MRVIGTAGHVDHGKSVLVEALTGIDPDRLKEEKERGMTIDLGFAWLTLPSGQTVSIVDVPGHEDFIKNMLAGVGGIDAALLVVAADEGVMPQTREHLAILDLLRVKSGIVALTKIDLIDDPEWLELVEADVAELLEGTCLEGAEIVPLSARTGQGLDRLLAGLDRLLAATASRPDLGRPRLAIDRVFTIAGFGTVVTGTLIDGRFRVGQEVEILPRGLKSRVRGLQTHKRKIEEAVPGSRVAMNLTGVSTEQLQRGDVVTTPGWLAPTQLIDVRLQILPDAPKPLKHNVEVEFFSGAAQIMARTRLLGAEQIAPGESGWAQLRLAHPTAVVRNDRFILRQPSPSLTIGGGVIVDPHPRRRHRRFRPEVIERLETLAHGTPEEILLEALRRQEPCQAREWIQRSGLSKEAAQEALSHLLATEQVLVLDAEGRDIDHQTLAASSRYLISASGWASLIDRIVALLGEYHCQYPLRAGMPREELKSRLRLETKLFNQVVELAAREGKMAVAEATLRLPQHQVRFSPQQQTRVDALLAAFARSPYTPPSVAEAEALVGSDVLGALIEQGVLVKVSEDVCFLGETYQEMVERVVDHIREQGSVTVAQVRDMFGASRKYALALMEHLDERRVTKRVGDERVLR
ncbi:MAG: selenocysteine-specific translation elongation factor [Anaerolineae bacterium]